jgi:xanthine dehydrogenase FAD-binding subunit
VPKIDRYAAPTTLDEAAQLMASGEVTLLAGGTDLMLQTRAGTKSFGRLLLNLRRVPEIAGVSRQNGTIRVGALSTVTEILRDPLLRGSARVLPEAADCFASGQVRNSATVGGNICNASPAGDLIIPLLLLEAEVELVSWSGGALQTRHLALDDFFVGPGDTQIGSQEILAGIRFAAPPDGFAGGFRKFGARPAMDIAVVSVGIAGTLRGQMLSDVRVAFGALAPIPLRGGATETAIEGRVLDEAVITAAVQAARQEVAPISDVRASAWYRKQLVGVLTERLLRDVGRAAD